MSYAIQWVRSLIFNLSMYEGCDARLSFVLRLRDLDGAVDDWPED